jgi:hypothetical protein
MRRSNWRSIAHAVLLVAAADAWVDRLESQTVLPGEQELAAFSGTRVTEHDRGEGFFVGGSYRKHLWRNWVTTGEGSWWQETSREETPSYQGTLFTGGVERQFRKVPFVMPYAGVGYGGFFATRFDEDISGTESTADQA